MIFPARPLALALLLLGGCTGLDSRRGTHTPEHPTAFEAVGRIGVVTPEDGFHGRFRWWHGPEGDLLELSDPLGQVRARIQRLAGDGGAVLELADGRRWQAADAASLSRQVLGWHLPLEGLAWWIRGRPVPGGLRSGGGEQAGGRMEQELELEQDGWRLHWRATAPGGTGPDRLDLSRPGLEIRLRVRQFLPVDVP